MGSYDGLKVGDSQVDDLIGDATSSRYNPIYIFYNHPWTSDRTIFSSSGSRFSVGERDWGCAVSPARFVKGAGSNKLSKLLPGMYPWGMFFTLDRECGVKSAIERLGVDQEFYGEASIPEWVRYLDGEEVFPFLDIGAISMDICLRDV